MAEIFHSAKRVFDDISLFIDGLVIAVVESIFLYLRYRMTDVVPLYASHSRHALLSYPLSTSSFFDGGMVIIPFLNQK